MAQKLTLTLDSVPSELEVLEGPEEARVRLGDRWHTVDLEPAGSTGLYSMLIDGRSYELYARPHAGGWDILVGNHVYTVESGQAPARRGRVAAPEPEGVWVLRSPLSGVVTEIRVGAGDEVAAGQVLLLVESMKMNNELKAARGGIVSGVLANVGERVERGAALVRVE